MKRVLFVNVTAALLWLTSCGDHSSPIAPSRLPVTIVEVFPPPRSIGVQEDTEIWVRFSDKIDPQSLDDQTVTLRVDARYIPIEINWNDSSRIAAIRPLVSLPLQRTHTVRLTEGIKDVSGSSIIAAEVSWQFTLAGVRRPHDPLPPNTTSEESPFARLSWHSGDLGVATIEYELTAGEDSAKVADRAVPPIAFTTVESYVPIVSWPRGKRVFWSITARNHLTRDVAVGPTWSFESFPADAPVESMLVDLSDWGYRWIDEDQAQYNDCFNNTFETGGKVLKCAIRWELNALRGRKLAGATITLGRGSKYSGSRLTDIAAATDY